MRQLPVSRPRRILLTLDAVGGVWSYAVDAARMLSAAGDACLLVGFGPPPSSAQLARLRDLANVQVEWTGAVLDWALEDEAALADLPDLLGGLARSWQADVVHVSSPSQAADLPDDLLVVAQSHSCVPTWWHTVRGGDLPDAWQWQKRRNQKGLTRADIVIAPSISHGRSLQAVYGPIEQLRIVRNGTAVVNRRDRARQPYVFAAARWWDEGKNAAVLDEAAAGAVWPILMAGALEGPNGAATVLAHATHAGILAPEAMADHFNTGGIFAAPSRYEPFGLAVLEAASHAMPLLLADIPTFRELWSGAARFVEPCDARAWREEIRRLAGDDQSRVQLGECARRRAEEMSLDRQASSLSRIYDDLLRARLTVAVA